MIRIFLVIALVFGVMAKLWPHTDSKKVQVSKAYENKFTKYCTALLVTAEAKVSRQYLSHVDSTIYLKVDMASEGQNPQSIDLDLLHPKSMTAV